MAENNVIYTVVTPDVPKAIPGEQLYVYVPRASFTNPGIAAFDSTQFTIDANGIVSIKNEYVTQNEFNKTQFAISETGGISIKDDYVKGVMQPTVKSLNDAVKKANDTADGAKAAAGRAESKADAAVATANGIDGKATQALTKATDALAKATNAEGQVDSKLDKASIAQETGTAEDKVMSQKVVTDALDTKLTIATGVHGYDQVYGKTAGGSQELFNVSDRVTTGAIVRRKNNGQIVALEATTNDGVVNLGQLTTKLLDYLLKSGGIISGNLSIQGDLEVRGTTKTTEEETLNVKDSIVVTNSSGADLSSTLAGFVIRLNATDCYGIIYDASSESVKLGKGKITDGKFTFNSGEGNAVAIRADGSLMTNGHLVKWDATALKFVDSGKSADDFVQYDDGGRIQTNNPTDSFDAVNKQYFEANGVLSKCLPLNPLEGADEITINQLLALKNGFYYVNNKTIKGWTTDIKGFFVLTKTGVAGTGDATIIAQGIGGDLIYVLGTYASGQSGRGWTRVATTDDITSAINGQNFKTIFDQSITGSGSITPYEAYLNWGGRNIAANFGPLDAALIPSLGANRLAFMPPDAITVEYSRDGGETWVDYPTNDESKISLFCDVDSNYLIGADDSTGIDKSKYMVRFTVNAGTAGVYTELKKFAIYLSTNGSTGCYCTIETQSQIDYAAGNDTWTTRVDKAGVDGWGGWNIINTVFTFGTSSWSERQARFTFGVTSHASSVNYGGLIIFKILGFGGVDWNAPSTMASKGRMYTWDYQQNVFFPQSIYANNKKLATTADITAALTGKQDKLTTSSEISIKKLQATTIGAQDNGSLTIVDPLTVSNDVYVNELEATKGVFSSGAIVQGTLTGETAHFATGVTVDGYSSFNGIHVDNSTTNPICFKRNGSIVTKMYGPTSGGGSLVNVYLPGKSGTLALTSDIPTGGGGSAGVSSIGGKTGAITLSTGLAMSGQQLVNKVKVYTSGNYLCIDTN